MLASPVVLALALSSFASVVGPAAAAATELVGDAPGTPPTGIVTPSGWQTSLAKASTLSWSDCEQEVVICAPTARMKVADLQMQVKSVMAQDVEPTSAATELCYGGG